MTTATIPPNALTTDLFLALFAVEGVKTEGVEHICWAPAGHPRVIESAVSHRLPHGHGGYHVAEVATFKDGTVKAAYIYCPGTGARLSVESFDNYSDAVATFLKAVA